jgi:hypothetical protein
VKNVATIATAIPPADTRLPLRAVAGEFIRIRPRTNATAPISQAICASARSVSASIAYASGRSVLGAAAGLRLNIWSIRSVTT